MIPLLPALLLLQTSDDTKSIDSAIKAVYDVISGPIGKKRDWNRMRSLFLPEAHMVAIDKRGMHVITLEDYIRLSGPFLEEKGFFEKEVSRKLDEFGGIAHVFSTYESRWKPDDSKPFERGINSIQLVNDGKRWWVSSLVWQGESAGLTIPTKYLSK